MGEVAGISAQGEREAPYGRRVIVRGVVASAHTRVGEDGQWQRIVLQLDGGRSALVAAGVFERPLRVGESARLSGFVEQHPEHGRQLCVIECVEVTRPTSADGVTAYLAANVPGCGPSRAKRIVTVLGPGCLTTLQHTPQVVRTLFTPHVGAEVELGLTRWATESAEDDETPAVLAELMAAGLGKQLARRVLSFFRSTPAARTVLTRHPYRLLEVPLLGWRRVDALARARGVAVDAPERMAASIMTVVGEAMDAGHSAVPRTRLLTAGAERAGIENGVDLAAALDACVAAGALLEVGELLQTPAALEAEWCVSSALAHLAALDRSLSDEQRTRCAAVIEAGNLTRSQADAVWMALERGVAVLTGGPGTGKTTTTRVYLACCMALGWSVKIATPSGKAASRAHEVTRMPAETIHRMLRVAPGVRRDVPVDVDVLVVDEVSMCAVETAAWLLDNIDLARTRVLLVGDADQLPSVEHGAVLADIVASNAIAVARLTEVHRQAAQSRIVTNAHALLQGQPLDLAPASDFLFHDVTVAASDADRTSREQEAARSRLLQELSALSSAGLADVQVLTPMRRGALGVDALNAILQAALNPHGGVGPRIGGGAHVRVGDRVIQVRNDYTAGDSGLFNGEQGIIELVDAGAGAVVARFGARRIVLSGVQLFNLRLAWAITVHRSQGSEWPTVVVLYHDTHDRMLDTQLLYTALTRARQRFVLIGTRRALATTARRRADSSRARSTGLARQLRDAVAANNGVSPDQCGCAPGAARGGASALPSRGGGPGAERTAAWPPSTPALSRESGATTNGEDA